MIEKIKNNWELWLLSGFIVAMGGWLFTCSAGKYQELTAHYKAIDTLLVSKKWERIRDSSDREILRLLIQSHNKQHPNDIITINP